MGKNVFVTGAAGFIGFHLACCLSKRGDHVLGYDNFNDYYTPQLKRDRASALQKIGVKIIEGDVCDVQTLSKAIEGHGTTHVAHLAAQAGVRYSLTHPQAYVKSNLEGFVNILEACKTRRPKLTYASSSSVYGLNKTIPFSEQDRTDHPASFYGATKKANELMANTYHHLHGISVTGLRFFTVYGPWGRPDMAYYSFSQNIMDGKPIEIFNHGRMRRDFTYIDDIIAGTVAAIDLEAACEVFNLGNHQPEELMTLVGLLEGSLGKKANLVMRPMQPGDVLETYADIEHSRKKLGFSPSTPLTDGIVLFIDWFKAYYSPNKSLGC